MKIRKFQIIDIKNASNGGSIVCCWDVKYRGIVNKKWIEGILNILGATKKEAYENAMKKFGGID